MKYSLPITVLSPWHPSAVATTQRLELCSDESTKVNLCYSAAERSYSACAALRGMNRYTLATRLWACGRPHPFFLPHRRENNPPGASLIAHISRAGPGPGTAPRHSVGGVSDYRISRIALSC